MIIHATTLMLFLRVPASTRPGNPSLASDSSRVSSFPIIVGMSVVYWCMFPICAGFEVFYDWVWCWVVVCVSGVEKGGCVCRGNTHVENYRVCITMYHSVPPLHYSPPGRGIALRFAI